MEEVDLNNINISPVERLKHIRVAELLHDRQVVFLEANIKIEDALEVLKAKKILSCPVLDLIRGHYIGWLDMSDIVTFILGLYNRSNIDPKSLQSLDLACNLFASTSVKEVITVATIENPCEREIKPVKKESLLLDVIEKFYMGIHRVAVVDDKNQIYNLISQTDVIAFMAQNIHLIREKAGRTLKDFKLGVTEGLVSVKEDDSMMKVLKILYEKRISAVPIVDGNGKLVATFSTSDLKGMNKGNFPDLLLTVKEFLNNRIKDSLEPLANERVFYPFTVTLDTTLPDAICRMVATRVHRLWCVDKGEVVGIVSMTDLMKVFLDYTSNSAMC